MPPRRLTNTEKQWLQLRQDKLREKTQKISYQIYQNRLRLNRYGNQTLDWIAGERIAKNPIRYMLFKLYQLLIKTRIYQRENIRKNSPAILETLEGFSILLSFILTLSYFPIRDLLNQNHDFTEFWLIPALFFILALILDTISEDRTIKIPQWIFVLISSLANGVWLALSLETLSVLNSWYAEPEVSTWEPLFTATGLSSAGVLAAQRYIEKVRKRNKSN